MKCLYILATGDKSCSSWFCMCKQLFFLSDCWQSQRFLFVFHSLVSSSYLIVKMRLSTVLLWLIAMHFCTFHHISMASFSCERSFSLRKIFNVGQNGHLRWQHVCACVCVHVNRWKKSVKKSSASASKSNDENWSIQRNKMRKKSTTHQPNTHKRETENTWQTPEEKVGESGSALAFRDTINNWNSFFTLGNIYRCYRNKF